MQALGLHTCADVRMQPVEALEREFGRWGRRLHELAHGIDERAVQSERATLQVSSEDTFPSDLPLEALDDAIRTLADKTWRGYQRERERHPERIARTVVLKLKTSDFRTLTRSLTGAAPPADGEELAAIAASLRTRVALPADTRYRLVGVGLSGFIDLDDSQGDLLGDVE